MKELFKKIREFFWPVLEDKCKKQKKKQKSKHEQQCEPKTYHLNDLKISEKQIDESIERVKEYLSVEKERSKTVETKSSIFIGAFSIAITIMISFVKESITKALTKAEWLIVAVAVMSVIYLCRAILYSIASLRKRNYCVNAPYDYIFNPDEKFRDKREILVKLCNAARHNENVTNQKVDDMNMAQLFFKRAVVCVLLLTLILVVVFFADEIVPVVRQIVNNIQFHDKLCGTK